MLAGSRLQVEREFKSAETSKSAVVKIERAPINGRLRVSKAS